MLHSKNFSPSGSSKWLNCFGQARMVELVKEQFNLPEPDWTQAKIGTIAHSICESLIKDEPFEYDQKYKDDIDPYMEDLRYYADSIKILNEYYIEQVVNFGNFTGYHDDSFGNVDCIVIDKPILKIRDFKFGYVPVPAYRNSQLMLYALGAIQTFDLANQIEIVNLSIFQPKVRNYDEWTCDIDELLSFGEEVKLAAKKVISSSKAMTYDELEHLLVAGEKQCTYCPAVAYCPKVSELIDTTYSEIVTLQE